MDPVLTKRANDYARLCIPRLDAAEERRARGDDEDRERDITSPLDAPIQAPF